MEKSQGSNTKHKPDRSAHWESLMLGWESSGLTKFQFCKEQKLTPSIFYRWHRILRRNNKTGFIPVKTKPIQTPVTLRDKSLELRIQLPNGVKLFISESQKLQLVELIAFLKEL